MPSGIGTLNIITRKQYAAPSASSGTNRVLTTRRTRRAATAQNGTATPYMTAHVCGLRYPSGMCIEAPGRDRNCDWIARLQATVRGDGLEGNGCIEHPPPVGATARQAASASVVAAEYAARPFAHWSRNRVIPRSRSQPVPGTFGENERASGWWCPLRGRQRGRPRRHSHGPANPTATVREPTIRDQLEGLVAADGPAAAEHSDRADALGPRIARAARARPTRSVTSGANSTRRQAVCRSSRRRPESAR